ncbi:MAG TPA: Crp/Fnr family transcriptional regulator [Thermoanaerobaculia bacterium]|nr:Crp/Fnr family transcriptional regulator [Thermoanaerobaculia bacterium]
MRTPPYGFEFFDSCTTCKWRTDGYFCSLPEGVLTAFDSIAFTNVYPEGAVLYSEGQPPRGVFVLCRGAVKLSISSGDGKTLITRIAQHGECLGLSSVLTGNSYKASAETIEPSQVNFIKREDFLRFIHEHTEACANSSRQLSQECEADADHIRSLGLSHSAAEKLAHLLLSWAEDSGKPADSGTRVQLLMTHEDISQLIGTSRETVTRLLKEFREKKIIAIKGSTLTILNKPALEALVLL